MKIKFDKNTKTFSVVTRSFSDWDQIRDLVNSQLPNGIVRVRKVRGSEDGKSYQVIAEYKSGKVSKPITIPIGGKSPLDNYNKATNSNINEELNPGLTKKPGLKYVPSDPEVQHLISDSNSKDSSVRSDVANNQKTPSKILEKLSEDPYPEVRVRVAGNPNTPPHVLEKLSKDRLTPITQAVARNPNTSPDTLLYIYNTWEGHSSSIAKNPNVTPEILSIISKSKSEHDQQVAASNIKTPEKDLVRLFKQRKSDVVAYYASRSLRDIAMHHLSNATLTIDELVKLVNNYLAKHGVGSVDCSEFVSLVHLLFPDAIIKALNGHYYAILDGKVYSVDQRSSKSVEITDADDFDYAKPSVEFIDEGDGPSNRYDGSSKGGPLINLSRTPGLEYVKLKDMGLF